MRVKERAVILLWKVTENLIACTLVLDLLPAHISLAEVFSYSQSYSNWDALEWLTKIESIHRKTEYF